MGKRDLCWAHERVPFHTVVSILVPIYNTKWQSLCVSCYVRLCLFCVVKWDKDWAVGYDRSGRAFTVSNKKSTVNGGQTEKVKERQRSRHWQWFSCYYNGERDDGSSSSHTPSVLATTIKQTYFWPGPIRACKRMMSSSVTPIASKNNRRVRCLFLTFICCRAHVCVLWQAIYGWPTATVSPLRPSPLSINPNSIGEKGKEQVCANWEGFYW